MSFIQNPWGFMIIVAAAGILSIIVLFIFKKTKLFR
jgi:hypothetical protein